MKTILFIDGRNFLEKLEDVFEFEKTSVPEWKNYNFRGLLNHVLQGVHVDESIFYFAKIREHPYTKEKSQQLIQELRMLKTHLEKQDFRIILGGVVRGNYKKSRDGKNILVFKEKGVDVSIAVDIVTAACDKELKTAIIGSSDSDLQPAIRELNKRSVESIYLGFEIMPNKGLAATTKRTILIRNAEVIKFKEGLPI